MATTRRIVIPGVVQYYVLSDPANPTLLARVRWPDVYEAISPVRPDWQTDPGLFDLPYDRSSTEVTPEVAAALAEDWGAPMPADDERSTGGPTLIRRMPADWSNLSPAEKRAWSIERTPRSRPSGAQPRWRPWRRRRATLDLTLEQGDESIVVSQVEPEDVIDLTDASEAARVSAEES